MVQVVSAFATLVPPRLSTAIANVNKSFFMMNLLLISIDLYF
jgi:hypothetical protein